MLPINSREGVGALNRLVVETYLRTDGDIEARIRDSYVGALILRTYITKIVLLIR